MLLALIVSKTVSSLTLQENKLESCCYNRQKLKRDKWSSLFAVNNNVKKFKAIGTSCKLYKTVFFH
jgi:hypothetical protein